jgi:iron complex outermembrane receptor protein
MHWQQGTIIGRATVAEWRGGLCLRAAFVAFVACATTSLPRGTHAQDIQRGAQARREFHGTVVDSATRRPIVGANVRVNGTDAATRTDAKGQYEITGFFATSVIATARQLGYGPVMQRVDLSSGTATANFTLARRATELQGLTIVADSAARFLATEQATSTMSAAEVAQNRGQTFGETIKELPGVAIIQYGPSIAKPVVRGLHSQRIATVNDGVPQEGQQWGGEHAPEIDAFAANEIEVIRGPGTILYGSGALGGVVRVMPRPLPTSGRFAGQLSTNGFLNNRQGAASLLFEGADLRLPLIGAAAWRAQVSSRRAGDARTPDYYLPNTGFKELHYNAAVGIARPWGHSELSYSHFGSELGLYVGAHVGNIVDLERAMQNPYTTTSFAYALGRPNQEVRHDFIAWHTEIDLPKTARLEVAYGFQKNDRREFDNHGFASFGKRPAFALDLYTHSLDVQYRHPPIGRFVGTVGVSGMRQGNLSPGRSFLIPQYRLYSGGVFGLEEMSISRLTFTAGARYDARSQHAYQYGAPVIVSPDERKSYNGPSASFGTSLKLSDTWSLTGTLARAWRPPNVNERFSQGVHHGTAQYEIGDPTLGPERSFNTDATLRHLGARTRLEISTYRNEIDDYIYLRPRDPVITVRGAYPGYNYAHTDARLNGLEVTGQLNPVKWLSLYANGNVVRGTDRTTGDPLYDMPADRVTTSARFFGPARSWAIVPYFEVGGTIVRRQDHVPPVTVYKLPTAGYGLLNLELGATALEIGGTRIEPSLAVRNVLDVRYRDYLSRYRLFVNETGRDVVLRLSVPFAGMRR